MRNTLRWKNITLTLSLVLTLAVLGGCKGGGDLEPTGLGGDTSTGGSTGGFETTTGEGLPNLDIGSILFDPANPGGLQIVYFDYNSFSLRSDAMAVLSRNADLLKQNSGVPVQIAGHCDERGTSEYNFALGEKRALTVREHLMRLGVSGDRLVTISYGEESPADFGHNEAAWSKNRRCQFAQSRAL